MKDVKGQPEDFFSRLVLEAPRQEKPMNSRIEKLRKALHVDKYPLSLEKARLWTESFKESEGEPMVMRRAKALVNILENITIFIQDGELIVGNTASKPMGLEVVFWAGTWPQEEIDGLKS